MMEWLLKAGSCGGLDYMVPDFTEVSIATEKRRKTMTSMLDNEIEKVLSSFENQFFLRFRLYHIVYMIRRHQVAFYQNFNLKFGFLGIDLPQNRLRSRCFLNSKLSEISHFSGTFPIYDIDHEMKKWLEK